MTYAFIGIEMLYVEIDDPFADDPNDLPLTEEARAAGEDIVLNLRYVDGEDAVNRLRHHIGAFRSLHRSTKFAQGQTTISSVKEPHETDHLV